jgi:hypothetical protein
MRQSTSSAKGALGLPIVEDRNFLLATREVGYRSLSAAVAELLDNAIQAKARDVNIVLNGSETDLCLTVLDNGVGMDENTLTTALQFGGTDRFNDRQGMGRFGMGLPASSLSQARRLEVYSWKKPRVFHFSYLDLDEVEAQTYCRVPLARRCAPLDRMFDHAGPTGTLIVWRKCDRIDWSHPTALVDNLRAQVGRMFRYFLWKGIRITVNDEKVVPVDPLFCHKRSSLFGAIEYGAPLFYKLRLTNNREQTATVRVRFSELPINEWHHMSNEDKRRLGIAKGAGVSLVRAHREIAYGWYFMGEKRKENYDDWWRCEVAFGPELDEYFNPTHTKQEVCPSPALESALGADLEELARRLNSRVRSSFLRLRSDKQTSAVRTATTKSKFLPSSIPISTSAMRRLGTSASNHTYATQVGGIGYSFNVQPIRDDSFYRFRLRNRCLEVTLNQDHPFFEQIYNPICAKGNKRLRAALECFLLALARTEAEARDGKQRYWYTRKRIHWSNCLATFLGS